MVILAKPGYGAVKGDHLPAVVATLQDARDWAANAAGLRIVSVALTGNHHISREEVLAIAGVTGHSFAALPRRRGGARAAQDQSLDRRRDGAQALSAASCRSASRSARPSRSGRRTGAVSVIADDGTVLEPYVAPHLSRLPLVVGSWCRDARRRNSSTVLERHPRFCEQVRASILVGERRWNLRLKNGLDVRLPEAGVAAALERLVALDARDKTHLA